MGFHLADWKRGNMAKITKKQLEAKIKYLEAENQKQRQEILTLQAKVNFYETVQKQAGDVFNGAAQWINGFLQPPQAQKQ